MQGRSKGVGPWRIVTAGCVLAVGFGLVLAAGVASASSVVRPVAVLRFGSNVTLDVPGTCPMRHPNCEWMLSVDEPGVPAQTVVGTATSTSGRLVVAYPRGFCGVVQADVLIGPAPWRLQFGHKTSICIPVTAINQTPTVLPFSQTVTSALPLRGVTSTGVPALGGGWAGCRSDTALHRGQSRAGNCRRIGIDGARNGPPDHDRPAAAGSVHCSRLDSCQPTRELLGWDGAVVVRGLSRPEAEVSRSVPIGWLGRRIRQHLVGRSHWRASSRRSGRCPVHLHGTVGKVPGNDERNQRDDGCDRTSLVVVAPARVTPGDPTR